MTTHETVTDWLQMLGEGDDAAASRLWERFSTRMEVVARRRLKNVRTAGFDEEDVALSAFDNFCRAVQEGRYPKMGSRDDLWRLLAVITARKAKERLASEYRQKRGGAAPRTSNVNWDEVPDTDPTPELIALLTDECHHRLKKLADGELQSVAIYKLDGYTNEEIAAKIGYTRRTIQRMLKVIRASWEQESGAAMREAE